MLVIRRETERMREKRTEIKKTEKRYKKMFSFFGFVLKVAIPRLRVTALLLFEPAGAKEDGSSDKVHERIYPSRHPCTP